MRLVVGTPGSTALEWPDDGSELDAEIRRRLALPVHAAMPELQRHEIEAMLEPRPLQARALHRRELGAGDPLDTP